MKRLTAKEFIIKSEKIHGTKYDYSKVEYVNNRTKVCIICPKHGEFWQTPNMHLEGNGCPLCFNEKRGKTKKLTTFDFIKRANDVHGAKYDYSKVVYNGITEKVCIICPEHGEFWQSPNDHLNGKKICPKCAHRSYKKCTDEFIEEAKQKHGKKYDYSKVDYVNENDKVCIICPKHGEFWQSPHQHLQGQGCPKCASELNGKNKRLSLQEFISKSQKIHNNRYDYSKVNYVNTDEKVCIICPEHGEFWQSPHNHLSQNQGCPKCNRSHLEEDICSFLTEHSISFQEQKKFPWLKHKKALSLDFYLPSRKIAIECQGEQHFSKTRHLTKSDKSFEEDKYRDKIKKDLCEKNGIKVIYYSYKKYSDDVITNKEELLTEINKCAR